MKIKTEIKNLTYSDIYDHDFRDHILDHVDILEFELGKLEGKFTVTIEYEQ